MTRSRINALVDFYNAVSLRHLVPAGAFDLTEIDTDIELRLTTAGDHFTSPEGEGPVAVSEGEVAYVAGPLF